MDVYVGDKVQIINGGMDVTNGNCAKYGKMYGENGPLWAEVVSIVDEWNTGGKYGLPSKVTKVRCSNNGVVVWQVRPEDIAPNVIRASKPEEVQTSPTPSTPILPKTESGNSDLNTMIKEATKNVSNNILINYTPYAIKQGSEIWVTGTTTGTHSSGSNIPNNIISSNIGSASDMGVIDTYAYTPTGTWRSLSEKERKVIGSNSMKIDESVIKRPQFRTAWQNPSKRRQMLNNDTENIQNSSSFPALAKKSSGLMASRYDYQVIIDDNRYRDKTKKSLEDQLKEARASLGIHVHGNNNIAKSVKFYMYNRFKKPDLNMAHNKSFTHVFFSRPDLNLLDPTTRKANTQIMNHSEAAMVWRRQPEIFKLLTSSIRCGDFNDFNFLLSNQVTSFDIQDESLTTNEAGKSWGEYTMMYGDSYSGRTAGEFSCNFDETNDYSIINMIKLWITYIDNVSKGAWSPSYDLSGNSKWVKDNPMVNHVYTKTLDYASSVYVFKCGPDGEDVLYWTKYYGVFPVNTGASALSWNINDNVGSTPKLNIRFKYAFKRDLSPISLIEFNHIAKVPDSIVSEDSFDPNYNHSSRPYVGAPFIEMRLGEPTLRSGGVACDNVSTQIRLKYRKISDIALTDDILYRAYLSNRTIKTNLSDKNYLNTKEVRL